METAAEKATAAVLREAFEDPDTGLRPQSERHLQCFIETQAQKLVRHECEEQRI